MSISSKSLLMLGLLPALMIAGCGSVAKRQLPVEETNARDRSQYQYEKPEDDPGWIHPRAFHYYTNAVLLELSGFIGEATEGYKRALQIHPDSYEIRFSFARMLLYQRRFADIPAALDPIQPRDVAVYNMLADAYRNTGQEDSARFAYSQVVAQDSTNRRAYAHLAVAYQRMGDLDSLAWAYENMVRLAPDDFSLHYELGKLRATLGDFRPARNALKRSIELEPSAGNILAYVRLAELYQSAEMLDSAAIVLESATEVAPDDIVINRFLALYYMEREALGKALPYAQTMARLAPDDHTSVQRLAIIYFGLDSLRLADSIFTAQAAEGEDSPAIHFYLGNIAMLQEDYPRARDEFVVLTQMVDSVSQGWLNLGNVYRLMEQPDNSISAYQSGLAVVRDPEERTRLLFALGAAYEQTGEIEESVTAFEELLSQQPDHAGACNYLGYMLCDRGERLEYAKNLIERAVSQQPDNAAFLDSYGWVFFRLGEYDEALPRLRRAAELDNDPVILDHLGDTYEALGDMEQARQWWQKALEQEPDDRTSETIREKLDR